VKTYIEELLTTFSGFHQTIFSFLTAHSLQQLFPQLTTHNNFFHSHSPTKQTLRIAELFPQPDHKQAGRLVRQSVLCNVISHPKLALMAID
jgi:hypothetical protein